MKTPNFQAHHTKNLVQKSAMIYFYHSQMHRKVKRTQMACECGFYLVCCLLVVVVVGLYRLFVRLVTARGFYDPRIDQFHCKKRIVWPHQMQRKLIPFDYHNQNKKPPSKECRSKKNHLMMVQIFCEWTNCDIFQTDCGKKKTPLNIINLRICKFPLGHKNICGSLSTHTHT